MLFHYSLSLVQLGCKLVPTLFRACPSIIPMCDAITVNAGTTAMILVRVYAVFKVGIIVYTAVLYKLELYNW